MVCICKGCLYEFFSWVFVLWDYYRSENTTTYNIYFTLFEILYARPAVRTTHKLPSCLTFPHLKSRSTPSTHALAVLHQATLSGFVVCIKSTAGPAFQTISSSTSKCLTAIRIYIREYGYIYIYKCILYKRSSSVLYIVICVAVDYTRRAKHAIPASRNHTTYIYIHIYIYTIAY